jgi:hypothetical protein
MIIENTLYVKINENLIECNFVENNNKIQLVIKNTWNIMPKSSTAFSSIIIQSVLGKPYVVIPLPKEGQNSSCINMYISELEGYKIINAKYESNVLMVIGNKNGNYDRLTFIFKNDYSSYVFRIKEDVQNIINFTVLDNGVCVSITEDEKLEMFINNPKKLITKIIDNDILSTNMKLYHDGTNLIFTKDNKVYKMKMK